MVTRTAVRKLYLTEWREHLKVSADEMAERLGIQRESVYRLEREQQRVNPYKQIDYAKALKIQPEDLWRLPTEQSLDALVRDQGEDVRGMAADIVRRLVAKKA